MTCVHSFSKCCNGKSSHIFGSFDNNLDRAGFYDQNLLPSRAYHHAPFLATA